MTGSRAVLLACALAIFGAPLHARAHGQHEDDTSSPALRVDWKEFRKLYDAKAIEVIDVRGQVFYESGHIPGARSIPLEQIEQHASELHRAKKPIVLYCA